MCVYMPVLYMYIAYTVKSGKTNSVAVKKWWPAHRSKHMLIRQPQTGLIHMHTLTKLREQLVHSETVTLDARASCSPSFSCPPHGILGKPWLPTNPLYQ